MTLANLLARNTFFSFISFFFRFLFNSIVIFKIAHSIGVENFGIFTFAQSYTGIFVILADFGISTYLTREIASQNRFILDNLSNVLKLRIMLSILSFALVIWSALVIGYESVILSALAYLMLAVILDNFITLYKSIFRGYEKFQYEAIITGYNSFSLLVFVFIAIYITPDVIIISQAYLLSRFFSMILTLLISKRIKDIYRKQKLAFPVARKIFSQTFPYGTQIFFGILYFQIDTLMLQGMRSNYEVGIYQVAMKVIIIGLLFCEIFQNSFLPTISRLINESSEKVVDTALKMNKYLTTLGLSFTIVVLICSKSLILLVGGTEFLPAVPVLRLLSVLLFIRFWATTFGVILTASGSQVKRMYVEVSASVVIALLNAFLIPNYGYMGAAAAAIMTNIFVLSLFFVFSYKIIGHSLFEKRMVNIVFVTLLLGIFSITIKDYNFLVTAPLITVLFCVACYFLILEKQEKKLVLSLFG